jgi:hypothetical protein
MRSSADGAAFRTVVRIASKMGRTCGGADAMYASTDFDVAMAVVFLRPPNVEFERPRFDRIRALSA